MGGNSGGGGNGGRSNGGGGSPEEQLMSNLRSGKLSLEESVAAERAMDRAQSDAFFKEKNYTKSAELDKKYKAMHEVNEKFKSEQAAKKPINWSKVKSNPGGSSVRDDALPRGYGIRSPAEAAKYAKANPMPKKQSQKEFDKEYEKRVGRKWDPTLF